MNGERQVITREEFEAKIASAKQAIAKHKLPITDTISRADYNPAEDFISRLMKSSFTGRNQDR